MSPQSPPPQDEDEEDAETERRPLRAQLVPLLIAVVVLVALTSSVVYLLSGKSDAVKPATFVQTVTLKPLPPPPPPPPPPPQKQEPKHLEQLKKDDLQPVNPNPTPAKSANPAPPGPPLGAALGSGGGADGFGAGGGGGGGGGGPGGKGYGPFVKEATEKIQAALARDDQTAFAGYHVLMTLWRDDSGRLLRCRLARSSGSAELDDRICRITMAIPDLPQNPPDQIGKPVTLSLDAKQVSN